MNIKNALQNELKSEYNTTKRFFEKFPDGKNSYKPHQKNMELMELTTHIADIFSWPEIMINKDKLDFAAGDYQPVKVENKEELNKLLDEKFEEGMSVLKNMDEQILDKRWTMNDGEIVLADMSKYEALRHALNQITHHRAQLGVYFRLLEIPVPGSYGPSADEN